MVRMLVLEYVILSFVFYVFILFKLVYIKGYKRYMLYLEDDLF